MASLVYACMVPHGGSAIAEIAGPYLKKFERTRKAMQEIGRNLEQLKPDTIIVLTPHGARVDGAMCIIATERMRGTLADNGGQVEVAMNVDKDLACKIARASFSAGVPAVTITAGSGFRSSAYAPMDWGALVPLWFIGAHFKPQPSIVSITPSRSLSYQQHIDFGEAIARTIQQLPETRKIALIASADWAHAHSFSGPYGYHEAAGRFDAEVVELVKANELGKMAGFDDRYIEDAKPDGIWQALILHGTQKVTPLDVRFLLYEMPTYFGLLSAEYRPRLNGHI